MALGRIGRFLGRTRDWWTSSDPDLDGAAIDPAYNGWYVTAVPSVDDDANEDPTEPQRGDGHR